MITHPRTITFMININRQEHECVVNYLPENADIFWMGIKNKERIDVDINDLGIHFSANRDGIIEYNGNTKVSEDISNMFKYRFGEGDLKIHHIPLCLRLCKIID